MLSASASEWVAEMVRVASASWLWVPSDMSMLMTVRGPSFGNGGSRDGGMAFGLQAPKRSARKASIFSGSKSPDTESSALLGRK